MWEPSHMSGFSMNVNLLAPVIVVNIPISCLFAGIYTFTRLTWDKGFPPEFRVTVYVRKLSGIFPPFPLCKRFWNSGTTFLSVNRNFFGLRNVTRKFFMISEWNFQIIPFCPGCIGINSRKFDGYTLVMKNAKQN